MEPGQAEQLFERFCAACRARGVTVATGRFRTRISVSLVNDEAGTMLLNTSAAAPAPATR